MESERDTARRIHVAELRAKRLQIALIALVVLQLLSLGLSLYGFWDRGNIRTDARASNVALDARGDLFKFVLDLPEIMKNVPPQERARFFELQRAAGLPERSSVTATAGLR